MHFNLKLVALLAALMGPVIATPAHAERLCGLLPDASITWLPGVHHFSMAPHAPAALDFLCERFQTTR